MNINFWKDTIFFLFILIGALFAKYLNITQFKALLMKLRPTFDTLFYFVYLTELFLTMIALSVIIFRVLNIDINISNLFYITNKEMTTLANKLFIFLRLFLKLITALPMISIIAYFTIHWYLTWILLALRVFTFLSIKEFNQVTLSDYFDFSFSLTLRFRFLFGKFLSFLTLRLFIYIDSLLCILCGISLPHSN